MKKLLIVLSLMLAGCNSAHNLISVTYIDAGKSFQLGEGIHGSYEAKVENVGNADVEISIVSLAGVQTSLGILKPRQKNNYSVPENTKAYFKNLGSGQAALSLRLHGDTSLSMGYK